MAAEAASNEPMARPTNLLHFADREFILFDFWKSGTAFGMFGSMMIVFLIAVFHEAIASTRVFLQQDQTTPLGFSREHLYENTVPRNEETTNRRKRWMGRVLNWFRVGNALLYGLQWTLMSVLILFICTFNVWVIISVILGKTVGFFVFSASSDQAVDAGLPGDSPVIQRRACR